MEYKFTVPLARSNHVINGFSFLNSALMEKGKNRKRLFERALYHFQTAGLKHHALICRQLAQGKKYYPRIINPSL